MKFIVVFLVFTESNGALIFCYCLAETEEQDDNGNENNPKQNIFAEKTTSTVHSVTPFFEPDLGRFIFIL